MSRIFNSNSSNNNDIVCIVGIYWRLVLRTQPNTAHAKEQPPDVFCYNSRSKATEINRIGKIHLKQLEQKIQGERARIKLKTKIQCVNQVKCVYIQTQRASTIWWCLRSTKAKNGICHLTNPRQINFKLKQCNTHRHSLIHSRIINYIVQTREGCVYFSWFVTFTIQPSSFIFSHNSNFHTHIILYMRSYKAQMK